MCKWRSYWNHKIQEIFQVCECKLKVPSPYKILSINSQFKLSGIQSACTIGFPIKGWTSSSISSSEWKPRLVRHTVWSWLGLFESQEARKTKFLGLIAWWNSLPPMRAMAQISVLKYTRTAREASRSSSLLFSFWNFKFFKLEITERKFIISFYFHEARTI